MSDVPTVLPADDLSVARIVEEYLKALEAGEAPDREALLARHPEHAALLAPALVGLEFTRGVARSLESPAPSPGLSGQDEPIAGRALGDYRILREVGRGGMAVVYEAEQVSLGRRVALKVLPLAAILDPNRLQRFKNEAQAAAHLHHPHIVPVHAVGCERGVHYIAMHFVEGESLEAVVRAMREKTRPAGTGGVHTPISSHGSHRATAFVRAAVRLGVQAARALDHAHQTGIVHRDVKPGNLLVDATGTLWVTDFGLATSVEDVGLTRTGELLGTLRYMSPEQALAQRMPVDHRTDVYSLGATLYELLTLQPPFPGDDARRLIQDIASKEPVPPRGLNPAIPHDLETVLLKAMAKAPGARYATAGEMAADLDRFLENRPVLARRPSLAARLTKWSSRHRGLAAASFAALLLATAVLLVGNVRVAREEEKTARALERAESSLAEAKRAIDRFLVEIGLNRVEEDLPPSRHKLLEEALAFYESRPEDVPALLKRGHMLHALRRFEDALAVHRRIFSLEPASVPALVESGHMLWHLGRPEEALESLNGALRLDPNSALAHYYVGCVHEGKHRPVEAIASYTRAVELDPELEGALWARAVLLRAVGRKDEADADSARAIEIRPNSYNDLQGRATALSELGRWLDALAVLDEGIRRRPEDDWFHCERGRVLHKLGHHDAALQAFDRGIDLAPRYALAHANRANVLLALGRFQEALAASDRALEIDRTLAFSHSVRGEVLRKLGRTDAALSEFGAAIDLDPRSTQALNNRGAFLDALGRHTEALADFQRALDIDPKDPAAHRNRIKALVHLGRDADALAAYDRALEVVEIRDLAGYMAWACSSSSDSTLRTSPRTLELARQGVDASPREAWTWMALGMALYWAGSWDEQLDVCRKSMELAGGGATDWFLVAAGHARLGRLDEARRWYRLAEAWTTLVPPQAPFLSRRRELWRAEAAGALGVR